MSLVRPSLVSWLGQWGGDEEVKAFAAEAAQAYLEDRTSVDASIAVYSDPVIKKDEERIVTVEDAAELQLHQEHVLRLESRPANIEGKGAITIRDLVKNTLRMRPDRIVVGECRGGEALDMLQAMNTGHDGSLTTIHANSPRDVLSRLETLVLMAGYDLPVRAIREQIASAVDLIVQVKRLRDGSRRTTNITEVIGMEGDVIVTQELFKFEYLDESEDGKILGEFRDDVGLFTQLYDDFTSFMEREARIYRRANREVGHDDGPSGSRRVIPICPRTACPPRPRDRG